MSRLAGLFRRELELCGVTEGQTVAVLSQGTGLQGHAQAALDASSSLGAAGIHLQVAAPGGLTANSEDRFRTVHVPVLSGNLAAVEALKQADLVIDLVFLLYAPELREILDAGTRVLTAMDPQENLERLFPDPSLRRRVEAAADLLGRARELRVTNQAGTDVTYRLGAYPVLKEYGYTDEPGRWDLWPSGFVLTSGADDGVDGRVVAAPGDLIVLPVQTYIREPIEFTIEAGRIVTIEGGVEAEFIAEYMAGFDDPDAYGVSHIGWGLNEKAKWSALFADVPGSLGMDGRAFYGNVMFSTGPNLEVGGSNATPCHVDLPMRRCDLFLDGEQVIARGEILLDEMRPADVRRSAVGAP
jgi:2,5-dihydroxypyridine 5,6-dioxygenase